jgi:hypothetical protein
MKRYMTLGFAIVLAIALAVPALGGPSNPIASSAVSAAQALKVAKKAKQKATAAQATANDALSRANGAQSTANSAQSAASAAQGDADAAQTTADTALAETADVSADDIGYELEFDSSALNSTSPKIVELQCDAGETPISANGTPWSQALVVDSNIEFGGVSWYLGPHGIAFEDVGTAANWALDMSGVCIDAAG